jgi:very-short-patch-repair endonuclease
VSEVDREGEVGVREPMLDRAVRLFEFLGRAQQLKNQPPRTVESYRRDGAVVWLAELPRHPAVSAAHWGEAEAEDALVSVDRVPRLAAPEPDSVLAPWLAGAVDDPENPPALRETLGEQPAPEVVRDGYLEWLDGWRAWADRERVDRPVRARYGELFSAYVTASGNPEELELVMGVGCLAWTPRNHPTVRRHLITVPVSIRFDDDSGRLTVVPVEAGEPADVELDMLDPGLVSNPQHVNDVRAQARQLETHPLRRKEIGSLVRRLVHTLDAAGEYRDEDEPPEPGPIAVAAFAPAVIMRRRSQRGLVETFQTIVAQLTENGTVPDGVRTLVDPDHRPEVAPEPAEGALVMVDDDAVLPLPVNDVQLRILRQVDTRAQTLVQGPPGTGKTHTAAALLSHLLAQGKRALVTAHTDRALREVRDKLPAAIKPLSVAVVGTSREDMSDLKVAVERIAAAATEHDPEVAQATIAECLEAVEALRLRRSELHRELAEAREQEVRTHEHAGYRGTLAAIAVRHRAESAHFTWLREHVTVGSGSTAPLTDTEITEWHGHLLDADLAADEPESRQRLIDPAGVPNPEAFADLVAAEQLEAGRAAAHEALRGHPAFEAIRQLEPDTREELQRRIHRLTEEADELTHRREAWMDEALTDVRAGRARVWQSRAGQIAELIGRAGPPVAQLGPLTEVEVGDGNVGPLVPLAHGLYAHLSGGGSLKTAPDGTPKIGALAPKPVKQAQPLFDRVRVDGLPPTTAGQVGAFLTWAEASKTLAALDRSWPDSAQVSTEDTLNERLQWHITELDALHRVLKLGAALDAEQRWLAGLRLPRPDWTDLDAVRTYADLVDAAAATDASKAAAEPLRQLEETLVDAARWDDAAPCVHNLLAAVRERDHDAYAAALRRVERLGRVRETAARRDELGARLSTSARNLREAIERTAADPQWTDRLAAFEHAWAWASTGAWVVEQGVADVNALQAEIGLTEERIRRKVETLSATRAWGHAVSPDRLTGQARANLEHYAYLVRRLGKGTGRYAGQRRAEIRQAMDRCRPAVPVWIMPIYRIAEQLQIHPNMFDVVIVDEASQAGLEATFLQYLAPKMVVIGDDKQVSPSAVGIEQQQLRDLAGQYLADDPYRSSWQDPQRSLFDEAKMRYHGLLTLTEHRRCVPEIIAFSNRIAYEPDGIRLVPVRQYGADRLEPIVTVHLPDGYQTGSTSKINPVEVDAIVETIEKCIADPRYDGLTFGVISLLGPAQAKIIARKLLERIAPEDWAARRLQCGDSADFQGAERDVMFLSMVAVPSEHTAALTRDLFVQRYNVAASRAKDQMWLFHSIALTDLRNAEDMRFQLLDHCSSVISRRGAGDDRGLPGPVPEDHLVEPFRSLFEQRLANRLLAHGYTVIPRHPVAGHHLDLVVVGARSRLAIECDGDTWQGPEAYERELARQRDLERCGWQFFRIRESAFYIDQPAVLDDLLATLAELDIHPLDHLSTEDIPEIPPAPEPAPFPTAPATEPTLTESVPAAVPSEAGAGMTERTTLPGPSESAAAQTEAIAGVAKRTILPATPATSPQEAIEAALSAAATASTEPAGAVDGAAEPGAALVGPDQTTLPAESATTFPDEPVFATAERVRAPGDPMITSAGNGEPALGPGRAVPEIGPTPASTKTPSVVRPVTVFSPATGSLAPYDEYSGTLPPVLHATTRQLVDGLVAITAVEGPVVGHRLHNAYVQASQDPWRGRLIANALNSAITTAVHYGLLVEDNPLSEPGAKPRTYRLPDQPAVRPRLLGPRPFEHIPPRELATMITLVARHHGWDSEETLYRATLDLLGLRRLTITIIDRLAAVLPLTQGQ